MPSEFTRDALHLALGVRQQRLIVGRLIYFVGRPRLRQPLLKLLEIIGADGTTLAAQHDESDRPIEPRYLRCCQRARNLLGEAKARNSVALAVFLLHVIVDLYIPIPERDSAG